MRRNDAAVDHPAPIPTLVRHASVAPRRATTMMYQRMNRMVSIATKAAVLLPFGPYSAPSLVQ
jgi:hypothetical protein